MQATIDLRFAISIDENKTIPLTTLAEFVTERNIEPVLLESMVESLDAARVEAFCGKKYATGNGDRRFQRAGTDTRTAVSGSIKDRVRSTLVAVSWLADTPWIHDEPIVDRSFVLDTSVTEYDSVVLIQIGSHLRELRWTYVRAEFVRIRVAMHQSIGAVCELCPFWEFSKPLSLFIA